MGLDQGVIFSILSASLFFVQLACKRILDEDFKIMIVAGWSQSLCWLKIFQLKKFLLIEGFIQRSQYPKKEFNKLC